MKVDAFRLPGLDGSNPLGFLAALGLLRVLDHRARLNAIDRPRLRWIDDGYWHPEVSGAGDLDEVVQAVLDDARSWERDPAFTLAYDATGQHLLEATDPEAVRDLKPKPAAMVEFLDGIAAGAENPGPNPERWLAARRSMDTACAYGSEFVQDRTKGNTKPLAFHFTAGQQTFLDAAAKLRDGLTVDDVREALLGPWRGQSKLPSMSWDATVSRNYALRASDPSLEKRGSTPGADWLAYISLGLFLVTPVGGELITAGVRGRWKNSSFTWPLWNGALTASVIRSVLSTRGTTKLLTEQRRARGIGVVFSSAIIRSDQGGYGSFAPARVL